MKALLALLVAAGAASAQTLEFGRAYAFAERPPQTPLEQRIHELLPSIVKVHGASGLRGIESYASGVLVSDKGHVLTLDLIMLQPGSTRVVLYDGSVRDAELLPADRKLGVRILKFDPGSTKLQPLKLHAGPPPLPGTFVVSLGNAFRLAEFSEKVSATFGLLVARAQTGQRYRLTELEHEGELWITDAPNSPGHGGGGLFTLRGEWIGLNARLLESTETNTQVSAAIPAEDLHAYVSRILRGDLLPPEEPQAEPVVQPYTGVVLFDRGGRRSPPAYVERVEPDSPAAAAGLRPDDLIVRVGQKPIRSCAEFEEAIRTCKPGDELALQVKRGREILSLPLRVEAAR